MALEQFFSDPRTLAKLHGGPLMLDGFCGYLANRGFSTGTIRMHLCYVSHFNDYLRQTRTQSQANITARDVAAFFNVYSRHCRWRGNLENHLKIVRYAINRFIDYLTLKNEYDPLVTPALVSASSGGISAMDASIPADCQGYTGKSSSLPG